MPRKTKSTTPPAAPPPASVAENATKPAPRAAASGAEASVTPAPVNKVPRNRRELAEAIFDGRDPIAVGKELLGAGPDGERPNSVKARVWETLVDFLFGKQPPSSGASAGPNIRVVWDLPAPPHDSDKP